MNKLLASTVLAASIMIAGCASGLNSIQEREYAAFEQDGVLVKDKSPGTGVALGFLPGGGSFYAREPGYGILNLLLWPVSILWDPISGYSGSKAINYDVTRHQLKRREEEAMVELDGRLIDGTLTNSLYALEKRKVHNKFNYE